MIQVFDLREELRVDPERVRLTQALTLNADKPTRGLKGTYGLFGSAEWWNNIEAKNIPLLKISGIIDRAYHAGQGETGPNNMIDLVTDDGQYMSVGIYLNDPKNVVFFKKGHQAEILYALDPLKQQPASDGSVNCSRVAVCMSVSTEPVE